MPVALHGVQVLPADQLHVDVLRGLLPAQAAGQHLRGGEESQVHSRGRLG